MGFDHEFAHLQTVPVILAYALGMLGCAIAAGRSGPMLILYVVMGVQGAWEIVSEGLVWLQDPGRYRIAYRGLRRLPRALFWGTAALVAVAGWLAVLLPP